MRQGSNPKRFRGRTGRKPSHPRSQTFESNGPEVKVRGNAQQVVERYLTLARESSSAGDRITAESYFQHAEHYYRVMTANGALEDRGSQEGRQHGDADARTDDAADNGARNEDTAGARDVGNGRAPARPSGDRQPQG